MALAPKRLLVGTQPLRWKGTTNGGAILGEVLKWLTHSDRYKIINLHQLEDNLNIISLAA